MLCDGLNWPFQNGRTRTSSWEVPMAPGSMSLMSMVSIDTVYFIAMIKPRIEAPYI